MLSYWPESQRDQVEACSGSFPVDVAIVSNPMTTTAHTTRGAANADKKLRAAPRTSPARGRAWHGLDRIRWAPYAVPIGISTGVLRGRWRTALRSATRSSATNTLLRFASAIYGHLGGKGERLLVREAKPGKQRGDRYHLRT